MIQEKYSIDEKNAIKYAKLALDGLASHGGIPNDYSSGVKVIEAVVQSWINEEVVEADAKL